MTPHDDARPAGGRRAAVREREDAVIASLRSLGTALDGEPDPAFRTATRARLVAMAAVRTSEPAPAPRSVLSRLLALRPDPARSPVRRRLTAGLAGAALAVTALATLVAVATGSSPGDPLYALKRGTEQTQLALSGSDRGLTLLGFAHTRLTELAGLTGSGDTALAVETLRAMDDDTTRGAAAVTTRAVAGADAAAARQLATWGAGQSAALAALRGQLPAGSGPAADHTAALLARVTDRGTALAAAIGCAGGPAVGGTDPLGPVPVACPTTPAGTSGPAGGAGGSGAGTVPGSTAPASPAPAGGPTGTTPGSGGTGLPSGGAGSTGTGTGGTGAGGVPSTTPSLPSAGLPTTGTGGSLIPPIGISPPTLPSTATVPLPGTGSPGLPVPGASLPGTSVGGSGTGTRTGTGSGSGSPSGSLPSVSVCVPPLTIGSC